MAQHVDMNGLWSGSYSYDLIGEPVVFSAWFDDQSGALGGTITEPNTFVPNGPDDLQATIKGGRHGVVIDFIKTYTKLTGTEFAPIFYEGEANQGFTQVNGVWRIKQPNALPGTFVLKRISHGMEEAASKRRSVEVGK